jgi:hypothetical protein
MVERQRFVLACAEHREPKMVLSRQCGEPIKRRMSIEPLSAAVRDYLRAFDLTAIAVMRDGRTSAMPNPVGASAAWWVQGSKAEPVMRAARRHRGDIPTAARALGVALTEHATVLSRAKAAVAKIEAGMAWAQRTGCGLKRMGEASGSWVTRRRRRGCARRWSQSRPAMRRR